MPTRLEVLLHSLKSAAAGVAHNNNGANSDAAKAMVAERGSMRILTGGLDILERISRVGVRPVNANATEIVDIYGTKQAWTVAKN